MKNKGFTLVELLAVIVVLAVISIIVTPMVLGYIAKSEKSAYEASVQNVFDAAKIYITNLEESSDFPTGGILVTDSKLDLKNSIFTSGVIYRKDDGSIYVENVTDGTYCASGTKNDLQVVKGECETLDSTPPDLRVKLNSRTSSSLTIVAYASDNQSGVLGYSYSLDGKKWTDISNKSLYTVSGLSKVQKVTIYVRAYNNIYDQTMKDTNKEYNSMIEKSMTETKVEYSTLEVDAPTFKLSSATETSGTVKTLQIIYPKKETGYEFSYAVVDIDKKDEICNNLKSQNKLCNDENYANNMEWTTTENQTVDINLRINSFVMARIKYDNKYVYSKISIMGIVNKGPEATYIVEQVNPISGEWSRYKKLTINVNDTSLLAKKAYSFDGGKTWQIDNNLVLDKNQVINAQVRDKLGNITTLESGKIPITKVDSENPTTPTLSWKSDTTTTIDVNVKSSDDKSGINKYICYYGTNKDNLKESVEVVSSENNVTCHLTNLDVGTNYYIKAVVIDKVENTSESDIIMATPANKLSVAYKDLCANDTYCNTNEGMYIKFGNYTFVMYKKDGYKAILNGLYSLTSYGYNQCCDNGYSCTYSTNNFTTSLIGTSVLNSSFLGVLPTTYKSYINQSTYNTGWITLASSVNTSHTYSKVLSAATVTSTAHIGDRKATVYVGLIDYEEFLKVKDKNYFNDNIGNNYYWLSNLGLINNSQSLIDSYYYISFALAVRNNGGYEYLYETPNISNAYARPVISFKGGDEILSGKGTKASPYVLKTN